MSNIKIVDNREEEINENNYMEGGMYFHAFHRVKDDEGQVRHELEYNRFIDCVGIRKTAIVSASGEAKIMVLAWLIEPVEENFDTNNLEKSVRQDLMTAACESEVKKLTMRIDPSSFKSQGTDFTRLWKVVVPHPSETDIKYRDALSPIRVRVEYLPRVVAIENICPCGTHYILSKFGTSVDNVNFMLDKKAYQTSYHFEGNEYKNRIFSFFPSVTKLLLTCYDFHMLSDRPFARALRGRFSDSFRHKIDSNMDEIHRIKNNKSVPYLVVNWGIFKVYKHIKYINYQEAEVETYQRRKNEEKIMCHAELILHLKRDPLLEKPLDDLEFEPDTARPLPGIPGVTANDCSFCPATYNSMKALEKHIRENHQNDLLPCIDCKSPSPTYILSTGQLEKHIETFHKKENRFVCKQCSRRYRNKKGLTAHKGRCKSDANSLGQANPTEPTDGDISLIMMTRRNKKTE